MVPGELTKNLAGVFRLQEEEEGDLIGYNNDVSNAISGDFMPGFGKASADTE